MQIMNGWASRVFGPLLAISLLAGCGDDGTGPSDPGDDVKAIRLTIGNTSVTVDEGGDVTGGPVVIGAGATVISAVFLDEDGAVVSGLEEFELQVVSATQPW